MNDLEKLRVMMPHWIEHNHSHGREFADWAEQIAESNGKLADELNIAVKALDDAQHALEHALKIAGGPVSAHTGHHGHHHHHGQHRRQRRRDRPGIAAGCRFGEGGVRGRIMDHARRH